KLWKAGVRDRPTAKCQCIQDVQRIVGRSTFPIERETTVCPSLRHARFPVETTRDERIAPRCPCGEWDGQRIAWRGQRGRCPPPCQTGRRVRLCHPTRWHFHPVPPLG